MPAVSISMIGPYSVIKGLDGRTDHIRHHEKELIESLQEGDDDGRDADHGDQQVKTFIASDQQTGSKPCLINSSL